MKKKMALILVFAMIVTSSITVPFVSFAASTATEIKTIYGAENTVEAAPTKSTDELKLTAEYTYTSNWNSKVILDADALEGAEPVITVKDATGAPATPVEKTYTFVKGGKYSITLQYSYDVKPENIDTLKCTLKTKQFVTPITLGTAAEPTIQSITEADNEEIWYALSVDAGVNKGAVFSLLSGAEGATAKTATTYCADVYSGKTLIGSSGWDEEYGMMFDCPLMMETGTYYVKVYPKTETDAKVALKLSAYAIPAAEMDVNVATQTSLNPGTAPYDITLYSYRNRNVSGHWYKVEPTIPTGQKARYEISIDFGDNQYGDIAIALLESRNLDELIDDFAYVDSENNTFYAELSSGEKYYLKLTPYIEVPEIKIKVTVKPHVCEDAWFVSDADSNELAYGCPCGADDSIKASCVMAAKFTNVAYTNVESTPAPTFTFSDWWLAEGVTQPETNLTGCYTVSYENSKGEAVTGVKNIGKYTATIKFCKDPNSKNNLEGLEEISKTVKVVPAGTTLKSVTATKKGFTAKWKKQTTKTTGYQIQYSTSSTFKSYKTVTITKNTTYSKKVTKLKAKKKYYVRVRTYKTLSGTKYYSAWSDYKKVTTKK